MQGGGTANITNSTFDLNQAAGNGGSSGIGGGLAVVKGRMLLKQTRVSNCREAGGAMGLVMTEVQMHNCTFANNLAWAKGGRIDTQWPPGEGGAVMAVASNLTMRDSHLINNTALQSGGEISGCAASFHMRLLLSC